MKLAFIGLGVMGYPMAGHLARAGHDVTVFNRNRRRAEDWVVEFGGQCAASPADAARDAALVATCVGNDADLRAVTLAKDGCYSSLGAGAIHIDHTTVSAGISRELGGHAAQRGAAFLDAPVSGGQAGAEQGRLTIMVGGDSAPYQRVGAILDCYAKSRRLMGPVGCGQLSKMVNQICVAGVIQGLAEGLHFAESAGLDPAAVMDVIRHGAAQSWQMENRFHSMLAREFDFGFAVNWMRKDLDIVLAEASRNGAHLPVTALIDGYYAEVQAAGGGRWDTSSLLILLDRATQGVASAGQTPGDAK